MSLNALLFSIALLSSSAHAAVWPTTNRWDTNWESKYAKWVKISWKLDVFQNPKSPYSGVNPDCADTVYSMRAIFASQNGLPFAVVDPSTQKSILSNEMSKFDSQPAGAPRTKAFLKWLYNVLATNTLPNDTYPMAITRDTVHAGALMLAKESKHSYTVKDIRDTGVPVLYYSTQANRGNLKERSWPSVGYLFSKGIKQPSGFRYFRQPEDLLKPVWQIDGYSEEQYQYSPQRWVGAMQAKLASRQESASEAVKRQMDDACQLTTTRIDLVNEAAAKNVAIGSRCMNAQEYDDLSTPSRDGQTKAAFQDLAATISRAKQNGERIDPALMAELHSIFAPAEDGMSKYCPVGYAKGRAISLGEFRRRLIAGRISANPNDPSSMRWGDQQGPSEKAKRCPVY